MRKQCLTILGLSVFLLASIASSAQETGVSVRESFWQELKLPESPFVRRTSPERSVFFRVPADWKDQDESTLIGPHSSTLTLSIEEIPHGLAFTEYFSALLQPLKNLPGGADSLLVRRTTMSGLEAREIVLELPDVRGDLSRRIIWCTVHESTAIALILVVPVEHAAEVESYFRAVVQSVVVLPEAKFRSFEDLRSSVIKESKPVAINEVQELAAAFAGSDKTIRAGASERLASIFSRQPDAAIDLFADRSPMVRSAVAQAMVQSRNHSLIPLLQEAVKDRDLFVAEVAARGIAANADAVSLLRQASLEWIQPEVVARVWQFLDKQKQVSILNEIFSKKVRGRSVGSESPGRRSRTGVTVTAEIIAPNAKVSLPQPSFSGPEIEASRMLGALTLLTMLSVDEFKLNLPQIIATGEDSIIALALNLALHRKENLPPVELFKLLFSSSLTPEVKRLAALNIARSASAADIGRLEGYLKLNQVRRGAPAGRTRAARPSVYDADVAAEVGLTVRKIRLRDEIHAAAKEEREEIIARELKDPKIKEWMWTEFVAVPPPLEKLSLTNIENVSSMGETLFPSQVDHYLAIPQPAAALDRLEKNIGGLQLETARSQASFVLMLSVLRKMLGQALDAPDDSDLLSHLGIEMAAPISMAQWTPANAPSGLIEAERRAIVMRVTDRDRFERLLSIYQTNIGDFRSLVHSSGILTRMVSILPLFVPLTARAMLDPGAAPPPALSGFKTSRQVDASTILSYTVSKRLQIRGQIIGLIERVSVTARGNLKRDSLYVTYLGKTAVLTPDLESMSDILTRISGGGPDLSENGDFKRAIAASGDAVYFSDLAKVFGASDEETGEANGNAKEFGTLNVDQNSWENSYHINFTDHSWSNLLSRFKTEDLAAPRELLPKTTLAYFFLNFETITGWRKWARTIVGLKDITDFESTLSPGFENELLSQLTGECGVALFAPPNRGSNAGFGWAAFCKLKSDKLKHPLREGKLFKGTFDAKQDLFQLSRETGSIYATVKQNYLVVSDTTQGVEALDHKDKLAGSREYIRAAASAPADLIAFGGYNLEAGMPQVSESDNSLEVEKAAFISSLSKAFHSTIFYARATSQGIEARASVSMDREGRFSVGELSAISKDYRPTYAVVEASGVPIFSQQDLTKVQMVLRTNAAGAVDRIKEEIETSHQQVEKRSENELALVVLARRSEPQTKITLPITNPDLQPYLQSPIFTEESVKAKAGEIVGKDRDAWSVAKKLADWTHQNLKWKKIQSATPGETLATLEADCTEFSELYVAMARSLGLPARLVLGLAYSGNAFGGHAWVEVHIGEWIELDPTYGTTFADATHIRDSSGALLTYASLNLLEIEVLETSSGIAPYQKSARLLAETIAGQLSEGKASAVDFALITDDHMGAGSWEKLSAKEREEMSSAFRRVMLELRSGFKGEGGERLRVVRVSEEDERAEAVLIQPHDLMVKLKLVRKNEAWQLAEIIQSDTGLHVIAETLMPTINNIVARRNGQQLPRQQSSPLARVLIAIHHDAKIGLEVVERALEEKPGDQWLLLLKAFALSLNEKNDEALRVFRQLVDAETPLPQAVFALARKLTESENKEDQEQAVTLYQKYIEFEPYDPRAPANLAALYETLENNESAEIQYKRVIEIDSANRSAYLDLARLLALQGRITEIAVILDRAAEILGEEEDLFGDLISTLYFSDECDAAEELAVGLSDRFEKSGIANQFLGHSRNEHAKYREAISVFRRAATLMKDSPEPFNGMAKSYRGLNNWTEALAAADTSIKIAPEDGDGYYHRACALARLKRTREALQALEKAIELDSYLAIEFEEEEDLKSLSGNPRFKKLVEEFNKEQENQ